MVRRPPEPDPFVELTDAAVLREAVAARSDERGRLERARVLATWEGTLHDLAERGTPVVLRTSGDRVHRGLLRAVGIDHVAVRLPDAATVLIATDTIRTVRPGPGRAAPVAAGDRAWSQDRTLVEALALAVETSPEVALTLRETADPLSGSVIGLGEDVITLRPDGSERTAVYLPVTAVREVLLKD